jgi:hypothetical protein
VDFSENDPDAIREPNPYRSAWLPEGSQWFQAPEFLNIVEGSFFR